LKKYNSVNVSGLSVVVMLLEGKTSYSTILLMWRLI